MSPLDSTRIRNLAFVGHHGSGKTTLAEALLAATGAISRQGSVDKGTTATDFEPEEIDRQLSTSLALASTVTGGVKLNLLDAPGSIDFSPDAEAALFLSDLAVIVVSAVDGVQAQTEDVWKTASQMGLPRMIVLNKLDRERARFEETIDEIRQAFGPGVAPLELPIGLEGDFRGVIDLLSDTATLYERGQTPPLRGREGPVPDELATTEHQIHDQLVEGIVVGDDDLMARYLDGESIAYEELEATLAGGVAAGSVFPVLCVSAATGIGVDRLARLLVELAPPPGPHHVEAGDASVEVSPDPAADPLLVIAKTTTDQHGGRLSIGRLLSGTLAPDAVLVNSRTRSEERFHGPLSLCGRSATALDSVVAGDLVAFPRLASALTGDTFAKKGSPVVVPFPPGASPTLPVAIRASSRGDDDKLMSSLARLAEEDRGLHLTRDEETHQTLLVVFGELHLAVTLERLSRRFGVSVEREPLHIPYRETPTMAAEAEGRHKKQSGGHGQFGVCRLRIEPAERGGGISFVDQIVGGAIPRQYIPAVEKGVREAAERGGTFGHPVVDFTATLLDGKYHSVDSSEMSFKMAGILAFRAALADAAPTLLEPVSSLAITVPADLQGDVLGDLHARRARVLGTEINEDTSITLQTLVPTSELTRYAVELRALTGGRGRFAAEHDHYEPLPEHLVADARREQHPDD